MAGGKGSSLRDSVLNAVIGGASYTPPATVYVALLTGVPNPNGSDLASLEVSGTSTGYARQAIPNNDSNWTVSSGGAGSKSNINQISFGTATNVGGWGTVAYSAILDSATIGAGNILYYGQLAASKTIQQYDGFIIPANGITLTET